MNGFARILENITDTPRWLAVSEYDVRAILARIAELEAELAEVRARVADSEAEVAIHKARAQSELVRNLRYEARLAAVTALCDQMRDEGWAWEYAEPKLRATATGDEK